MKNEIDRSEIPTVRRDEPKSCWADLSLPKGEVQRRLMQNKANFLCFHPKNVHCPKNKPIIFH
jgi:hypothetical protein